MSPSFLERNDSALNLFRNHSELRRPGYGLRDREAERLSRIAEEVAREVMRERSL